MNTKHLLISSLVGGLISVVLANAPFVNLINLLVCIGFWIGPLVAVWLYRRQEPAMTLNQALVVGLMAGLWHGLFGLILSPLGLAGAGSLLNEVQPFMSAQDALSATAAVTGIGGLAFNLIGLVVDVIFGFIGGAVGGVIFKARQATAY